MRSPARGKGPFLVVTAALLAMLTAGNLPTPLYAVYRAKFGFSSGELTLIFATYMIVLIPSLLVFGQLSDRLGRRRVLAGGLVVAAFGLGIFAAARSTGWLFVARAVQGVGLGAAVGTAGAALVELEPAGDHARAALATVVGQAGGSAAGPLLAGALAQWAPAPLKLCFLIGAAITLVAALAVLSIRDPVQASGEWRLQKPRVPAEIRTPFIRASLTGAALWSVGGLFLSVVPSYASQLLATRNLALLGAIAATMLATACAAQVVCLRRSLEPKLAQPAGLTLLVVGLGSLVLAFPLHSLALVLVGALQAGAGLGFGFFGAQAEINDLAPPERRGEVTAAFITILYCGVSVTAIGVGFISDATSLQTAVAIVGSVVALTAVLATAWHLASVRRERVA